MMVTTHALAGLLVASVATVLAPDLAPVAMVAGAAGGAAPDLDLLATHRRTLHFPVGYPVAAAGALGVAFVAPSATTAAAAAFLAGAALHSVMDVAGGGLEARPWRGTSDRGVYDHVRGRWLTPRRWVRYDGAPEDLLLAGVLAVPALLVAGDGLQGPILAAVAVSAGYAAVRKPLVAVGERLQAALPDDVEARLPDSLTPYDEPGAVEDR